MPDSRGKSSSEAVLPLQPSILRFFLQLATASIGLSVVQTHHHLHGKLMLSTQFDTRTQFKLFLPSSIHRIFQRENFKYLNYELLAMLCKYAIRIVYFSCAQSLNLCIDSGSTYMCVGTLWHISYTRCRFVCPQLEAHNRNVFNMYRWSRSRDRQKFNGIQTKMHLVCVALLQQ